MKPIRLSRRAEADLEAIADFIAQDSPSRAHHFVVALRRRCDHLSQHPFQGRPARLLGTDVRHLTYRGYAVLYRVLDDYVAIDRILHGARDIAAIIARDDPGE